MGKSRILFELNNKTHPTDRDDPWMTAWRLVNNATFAGLDENLFETLRISQHKEIIIYLPYKNKKILEKEKVIGDW